MSFQRIKSTKSLATREIGLRCLHRWNELSEAMAKQDLVRPSRDGDQFHYHWAARQCLALLSETNDLVAVTIEGASTSESDDSLEEGDELIDVGLYYGSESLKDARSIHYIQLKHSTRHELNAWTASGLAKTISGFARRYSGLLQSFSAADLRQKVWFEFTTNRPIESKLHEALHDLANNAVPRHPKLRQTILAYTTFDDAQAWDFFQQFSANGHEPNLWEQRNLLSQDISIYLPEADYDSPIQLKELVTRKATTEFEKNPAIRMHDVLHALKVSETELQPSPCQIVALKEVLPREQHTEILNALLTADHPIIIHADGGVGKSMLAIHLAASMPCGSESILYDCFGDGLYRNALHFRHRHRDALVQISNELAARGLCHPLIPSSHADAKQYMRAFIGRLNQAVGILRAREPSANLCLLVDAADNADMAAEEQHEASFVRDLIRVPLPDGVRLAFTCRTHRRNRLSAPPGTREIELKPFSEAETARHLRGDYPNATNAEIAEFAFLSSSNPRVQALALERKLSIQDMLKELGPTPSTVDRAIGDLLQNAVTNLKDRAGGAEAHQIDMICQGLAVLRPLVPIAVLAQISGAHESAIRSFALDLGRPLLLKGNSLHFLDEPAETWFRERFKPDSDSLTQFLVRLRPLAKESSYIASTLPQLLLAAGQMDELVELALSTEGLPTSNALERRDVELQRLLFALKACLHQGRHLAAAKLALKAGGEAAGESRQTKLIQENTDIAAVLLSPDRIDELVSRRTFGSTWMGSSHAYDAGLLSGRSEFSAEANSRLRMAMDWLYSWARRPRDQNPKANVNDADKAELAMAILRLRGAKASAKFLKGWTPRHSAFVSGKLLARRLIDLEQYDQLDALAHAAGNDIWLLLGIAIEVESIGSRFPLAPLSRLMRLLSDRRVMLLPFTEWNAKWDLLYAVSAAVALAVHENLENAATLGAILRRYLPEEPPEIMAQNFGFERAPMLRAYSLEAALRGHQLSLLDVSPPDVRIQLDGKGSHGRSQEAETFQREVGGLLPWFILSADIICGNNSTDLRDRIDIALQATAAAESRDYQQHHSIRQTAALEWLMILRNATVTDQPYIDAFRGWFEGLSRPLWTKTWTSLCRIAARAEGLSNLSLEFAAAAYDSLEASRDDAESRAYSYMSLARAIVSSSPSEAAAYFNRAVEISSRIGEENLVRWFALLHLANAAAQKSHPRSRSAYRLSRAAELTYEYVARDKHFDWTQTTETLTDLCGSSALAILSRWRDRRFGRDGRLIPIAIYRLIEHGQLPASTPIVLSGIDGDWNRLEDLKHAIHAERQPLKKLKLVQIAYRYMRVQTHDAKTWAELKNIGDDLGLELLDIKRLLAHSQMASMVDKQKPETIHQPQRETRQPDWKQLLLGVDIVSSDALKMIYAKAKNYDPPFQFEDFFREGIKIAGLGKTSEFLRAISAWPDFGIFEMKYFLEALPKSALKMLSVRAAIRDAVMAVCLREPEQVLRKGWWAYFPFESLNAEGIVPDSDVVQATLQGYAAQVDTLSAEGLFRLVDPLASCLSFNDADEALNFGLDLLEEAIRPEDGDGPWCDALQPPSSCIEALAGYIWVGLGSPKVADRWEFAHVVRTCVELNWSDLLSALLSRTSKASPYPFIDNGLKFYEWHALQWMLIGLARGSKDQPTALNLFIPFLLRSAAEQHVVIRWLAAEILRVLNTAGLAQTQDALGLAGINQTTLPLDTYSGWREPVPDENIPDEVDLDDEEKYYFGMDIGPYWFAPLGKAFGLTEIATEKRARLVLRDRLDVNSHRARDDARYQRKIFEGHETSHSHGCMPLVDDLCAYHSYHAMMIVAAKLLNERPVRKRADHSKDEFQDWIGRYLLTCPDDRWLADRRDPRLVVDPPSATGDKIWCWNVTKDYLDQQLQTDDGLHAFWGDWSTGYGAESETVSIRSALVSRTAAGSLLAALQTAPEADRFFLPDADRSESLNVGSFRLIGWVTNTDEGAKLDEGDPWATRLHFPGSSPSTSIVKRLGLNRSSDGRRWAVGQDVLLRSESWTRIVGYGRDEESISGIRLSGSTSFVQLLLEKHPNECLMLSVSIQRLPPRHGVQEFEPYPWPYVRYYLMDCDGIVRTL